MLLCTLSLLSFLLPWLHSVGVSIRIVGVVIRMQIAKLKLNVRGRGAVEEGAEDS